MKKLSSGILLFFTILSILPTGISSAEPLDLNKKYFTGYISDAKNILESPLRWNKQEWFKASLIAGITGGLYAFDQDIHDWMNDSRSSTTDDIAKFSKPFGNGLYVLPSLGSLYLYGYLSEDNKAKRVSLLSIESFLISGAFTQAIKFSGHRHRPDADDGKDSWDGPGFSNSNLSFSSGHSSSAFAIGTVIASEYSDNPVVPPLAYGLATLTALSRVNDNAHWSSDVFFGSAIGYFTAKAILALHDNKKESGITLLPVISGKRRSIAVAYIY